MKTPKKKKQQEKITKNLKINLEKSTKHSLRIRMRDVDLHKKKNKNSREREREEKDAVQL